MSRHRMDEVLARRRTAQQSSVSTTKETAKAVKESLVRPSSAASSSSVPSSARGAPKVEQAARRRPAVEPVKIPKIDLVPAVEIASPPQQPVVKKEIAQATQQFSKITFDDDDGDLSPNYDDDDDMLLLSSSNNDRAQSPLPVEHHASSSNSSSNNTSTNSSSSNNNSNKQHHSSSSRHDDDEYDDEDEEHTESDEYSEEEEDLGQNEKQRKRGRPPGSKNRATIEKEQEGLPRASIIRLVKTLNLQSITKDLIDACVEIIENCVQETKVDNKTLTYNDIHAIILRDFKDAENELPEETQISAPAFTRFVTPILKKSNCGMKRDAFFLFHLYCEAFLLKMLKAAEVIATVSGKRTRVQGTDLSVAYHVYNL